MSNDANPTDPQPSVPENGSVVANPASNYCYFFDDHEFEDTDRPGFRRRIILGDHLELWFWRIKGGVDGSFLHNHEANEQLGVIMRGSLDFRIGDPGDDFRTVLKPGDVYLAAASVWHGDSVFIGDDEFGEVWILDVFAPPRTPKPNPVQLNAVQQNTTTANTGMTVPPLIGDGKS